MSIAQLSQINDEITNLAASMASGLSEASAAYSSWETEAIKSAVYTEAASYRKLADEMALAWRHKLSPDTRQSNF